MKKTLLFLAVLTLLVVAVPTYQQPAVATETVTKPHVVIGTDVWLYATDGTRLFLLPKTYYAAISSMDDYYYYVTFNGISGRVKKEEVKTLGYHATASGTMTQLGVSAEYAEFSSILLKKTPDLSSEDVSTIPINATFTYVGSYPVDGEIWYAVKWEQHFGYVKAVRTDCPNLSIPDFVPQELPVVEDPPTSDSPTTEPDPEDSEVSSDQLTQTPTPQEDNTLKIVLIIGLIIPAVLIIVLIFRPRSKR